MVVLSNSSSFGLPVLLSDTISKYQEEIIIKKFLFVILACVLFLSGCRKAEQVKETISPAVENEAMNQPASPAATPAPTAAPFPYESLTFTGRDVNAQHYPRSYSAGDKELIENIWNVLNSPDRLEVSEYETYEDVMDLQFQGQNGNERVVLSPNDNCEFLDTGKKYSLAQGSYATVSSLLTDYTTANYSFTIDEGFLNIDTDSLEPLTFMFDVSPNMVMPSDIGDFTEDWVLIPADIQNWQHEGQFGYIQNIYTKEGFGPVEISVYFDELLIGVNCDGKFTLFYTDQNTMDSIARLVESLKNN